MNSSTKLHVIAEALGVTARWLETGRGLSGLVWVALAIQCGIYALAYRAGRPA